MKAFCLKSCLAECVGVFVLCFIAAGSSIVSHFEGSTMGLPGVALANGLVLSVAVTATINISGAHINPAVSIALTLIGRCSALRAFTYIIAQLVGAALAGLALLYCYPAALAEAVYWGTPVLAEDVCAGKGIMLEALATFLLSFAIYGTAVSAKAPKGIGGFGIGLMVTVLILAIGPLTGAAMNPARHFGTALVGGWSLLQDQWIYWLGPVVGASLGLSFFSYILEKPN